MRKQQAHQYFEHLKRIDSNNTISLTSIINIITAARITPQLFRQFTDYLKSNEFG